jgi:acetyltransferase
MAPRQGTPRPDADVLEHWQAADGTQFVLRPMRSDDAQRELDFVQSLSPQTRYERTFSHRGELAPGELRKLTRFDVREEVALVAVASPDAAGAFAAVARLKKVHGTDACEFAIVVADHWQRRGIGLRLLDKLLEVSRRAGIARVIGYTFSTNEAMKALARKAGFTVRSDSTDPSLSLLEIDLSPHQADAPAGAA